MRRMPRTTCLAGEPMSPAAVVDAAVAGGEEVKVTPDTGLVDVRGLRPTYAPELMLLAGCQNQCVTRRTL